ncbi:hypothetical protein IKO18_04660 [bacterium]|nr:hypothetical protein [bacterium]
MKNKENTNVIVIKKTAKGIVYRNINDIFYNFLLNLYKFSKIIVIIYFRYSNISMHSKERVEEKIRELQRSYRD